MGSFKITGLGNGTANNDAVTKGQLDAQNTSLTTAINTAVRTAISNVFPVGSIYIGTQETCPLSSLISGSTWIKIAGDKVLQSSSSSHAANTTIAPGLPSLSLWNPYSTTPYGCEKDRIYNVDSTNGNSQNIIGINEDYKLLIKDNYNIVGNSNTVQPPAYVVNVWRRTA
jgi:hypothetical protein